MLVKQLLISKLHVDQYSFHSLSLESVQYCVSNGWLRFLHTLCNILQQSQSYSTSHKVNINLSHCMPLRHTGGRGGVALLILNLRTRCRWM